MPTLLAAADWDPWFAWTMDLVKFTVTFGLGALLTVLVVDRIQDRRAIRRSRAEALFQLQLDALREFRIAAVAYEVAALSAYTDLYQWKSKEKTSSMRSYEGTAFGNYTSAIDRIEDRFRNSADTIEETAKLKAAHKARHVVYDALVDEHFNATQEVNLWERADGKRKEFDALLTDSASLRKQIIRSAEAEILK